MNILQDSNSNRLSVYPIKYNDVWQAYKVQQSSFWTAEEIDFSKDYQDFEKLNQNEQYFIKMILAFFAVSDGIVNMNLSERFIKDVEMLEAKIAYSFQMMMENIHGETYSLMLKSICCNDKKEQDRLFNCVENFECIKSKIEWCRRWIDSERSFAERLVAFAIVEGIFFSGAFASMYWLKKKNVMPGLCNANELIARDEASHTDFACLSFNNYINNKPSPAIVVSTFKEAVEMENEFIIESSPCELLGVNSNLMKEHVGFVADRLLLKLGYDEMHNTTNPFDFVESVSLEGKTNFFEHRPTQCQLATVANQDAELQFNDDF